MKINCLTNKKLENNVNYSKYCIKSISSGFGLTIGNIFRRIALSNLLGTSITGIKINSLNLTTFKINGLLEDFFELSLNIKKIVLKSKIIKKTQVKIQLQGPKIICAGDLNLPKYIEIINPKQYLFTITNNINLEIEFIIENGFGYKLADEALIDANLINFKSIDASFSPVLKFNYKISLEETTENSLKETLYFEIWTNGSITTKRAIVEICKIIIKTFSSFLVTI